MNEEIGKKWVNKTLENEWKLRNEKKSKKIIRGKKREG